MIWGVSYSNEKNNKDVEYINRIVKLFLDKNNEPLASESDFYGFYLQGASQKLISHNCFHSCVDYQIILSGIFYNSTDVSKELGVSLDLSQSELIYESFIKWGPEFVNKLNGDFIICIYSQKDNALFVFRDHLGIHPLAYSIKDDNLYFSSDIINLCRFLYPDEEINPDWLLDPIKFVDQSLTANKKVKKLNPGHYIIFSKGKLSINKYWFPEKIKELKTINYKKAIEDLIFLINDAIIIRSDKNKVAGAHLSGGLDSSLVAMLVRKCYSHQKVFWGFSYSPDKKENDNPKRDERMLVNAVANKGDIKPAFTNLNKHDYLFFFKGFFFNLGGFWEEKIREKAKKEKISLLFSGWGGDHFISKSSGGVDSDLFFKLKWGLFFKKNPINKPKKLFSTLTFSVFFPLFGVINPTSKKDLKKRTYYLRKNFKKSNPSALRSIFKFSSRRNLQLNNLEDFSISERCDYWYIQGFKYGIEYRYPLLDKRIIEYVLKIPSCFFFRNQHNRVLIRDIGEGILPEKVRWWNSKTDYVFSLAHKEMFEELAPIFIKDITNWKENPDLFFIDFPLLEKDVKDFLKNPESKDYYYLFRSLYYFKGIHEFTKTYRSLPPEAE